MSEQLHDFFGEVFQRYFRPAIDAEPRLHSGPVQRMFTLTDAVQDPLEQSRRGALAWGHTEVGDARFAAELFVITQCGLMYAAELSNERRALYYLATPPTLFDPLVDQVETAELDEDAVVIVDNAFGHDLASARPMDAALRRIVDEHWALRVNLAEPVMR
ncbi:glucose-6-phosphate 1-dehydrogenase [Mycolicibacterium chubuense NBB4]|uniref:Glucose-6-phosphate 1-dehydrogenase n=1 Tax=Mycolicibacterium chubuense (strain NBB4) TaxID=710421 RepID=I4BRN1_MYCCN|nr:glucose-6-phosphate 1-dehydrogenase [Mycolicibacterium chubuense]AFM19938.1 glucose-6-phosphate 1-dehydrogenase [Mycolicibacterium chubuense NBB4]